jgi:hypothetical protein
LLPKVPDDFQLHQLERILGNPKETILKRQRMSLQKSKEQSGEEELLHPIGCGVDTSVKSARRTAATLTIWGFTGSALMGSHIVRKNLATTVKLKEALRSNRTPMSPATEHPSESEKGKKMSKAREAGS